jgi:hypothetical protein
VYLGGRDLVYNNGGTVIPLLSFLGLVFTGIVCIASPVSYFCGARGVL